MLEDKEMRSVYCELLLEAAEKDPRICVLDADLMRANGVLPFRDRFPERTIDAGIAEANMIGVASGLSTMGLIPFAGSFCTFSSRRCYDQIFVSAAYAGLNVKILGTDPGITAELNGGTHMSFEDYGILRCIPEMTIVEPVDTTQLRALFPQILEHYGTVYIRLARKKAEKVFSDNASFTLGKAARLRAGTDAAIFSTGIMVSRALQAAEILEAEGISVRVENMHTIKPIDREAIVSAANDCGAIVTAENHNVVGGLASAVSEVAAQCRPVPMEFVGVQDQFGQVGKMPFLGEYYHLLPEDIAAAVRKAVSRK